MLHQQNLWKKELANLLDDISFLTKCKGGHYRSPRHMELHVDCPWFFKRNFAIVGDLTADEIYEVLLKGKKHGIVVLAVSSGDRAERALVDGDQKFRARA